MKKYLGSIIAIGIVLLFCVSACLIIILSGITAKGTNYVLIEINPKVEFLVGAKNKVLSVNGLNIEAKELLIKEKFIDLDIKDATNKFIELCAMAGYIDVDNKNAINFTILDGITQNLNVHIIEHTMQYLKTNEIKAVIMESTDDLSLFKEGKTKGVSNQNRLKTINTILKYHNTNNYTFDNLKTLKESQLIEIIKNSISNIKPDEKQTLIENKTKLINFNKEKYQNHKNKITNETNKNFVKINNKFIAENQKQYTLNFEKNYEKYISHS